MNIPLIYLLGRGDLRKGTEKLYGTSRQAADRRQCDVGADLAVQEERLGLKLWTQRALIWRWFQFVPAEPPCNKGEVQVGYFVLGWRVR